ncbi:MAG: hypothetical protein K8S87_04805, partial [Planctomycetes bacterium]|nr:hypothetical protein [Planctomycetota bacterium]
LMKWLWEPETTKVKEERVLLEKALAPSKLSKIIESQQEGTFSKRPVLIAGLLMAVFSILLFLAGLNLFKGDVGEMSGFVQVLFIVYALTAGISGIATIFNKNKITGIFQKFSTFSLILLIPAVIGTLLAAAIGKLGSIIVFVMLITSLVSFVLLLLNPE